MGPDSAVVRLCKGIDLVLTATAFVGAYFIRKQSPFIPVSEMSMEPNYYFLLLLTLVVFSFSFRVAQLYEHRKNESIVSSYLPRVFVSVVLGVATVTLVLYLIKEQQVSRIMMVLFMIFEVILLTANKYLFTVLVAGRRRNGTSRRNILVVGDTARVTRLSRAIQGDPGEGRGIIGCLVTRQEAVGSEVAAGVKAIGTIDDFKTVLTRSAVDEVVFTSPDFVVDSTRDCIAFAEKLGVTTHILLDWQLEKLMFRPEIASVQFDSFLGLPTVTLSSAPRNDVELLVKSVIDYCGAALALLLLSPLLAILAVLIRLESRGPVLFVQERSGYNGRRFRLLKFRTMVDNAEGLLPQILDRNEADGPVFKIARDPRVTALGRFLRRTSLDELPQLVNILRGEMSFVGPRPPIPSEVEKYEPWQRRRLSMKPGLTCIWQVYGRNAVAFDEWMRMDLAYIDNWSIMLDVKLIFLTGNAVLRGTGA